MGAFFGSLKNIPITIDKQLLNASGSKLREYFCSFRSICETFCIDRAEYMQIFGSNVKSFKVWDPDEEGAINAMQMFSGLIVFSKMANQDKIKFLYELFDLNETGYLQYDQLAFMFISVCEAVCKIYLLKSSKFSEEIIQEFLEEFFSDETKLTYQDFIRWSYRTEQIIEFFQIIGYPFQPQIKGHSIDHCNKTNSQSVRSPFLNPFICQKQSKMKINIEQRFLNLIKNDHILLQQNLEQNEQQFNPVVKWIYGIRIDDIRYPLQYRRSQFKKAANQKFLYICGKNIIVLYPKLNNQKNYSGHDKPVSCIEIAMCDTVVASGEMGINPSIHIWDLKAVKCLGKFDRIHKNSIKMLKFMKNDQLLITISESEKSALVVLNINTKQKILSTCLMQPVLNILNLSVEPTNDDFYIVLPSFIVQCSSADKMGYLLSYNKMAILQKSCSSACSQSKIVTGASIKLGSTNKIVLLNDQNQIALFHPETRHIQLLDNSDILNCLKKTNSLTKKNVKVEQEDQKIIDIFTFGSNRLYVLLRKGLIILQIDQNFNINRQKQLFKIPQKLFNFDLVQLIEINQNRLIVVSLMGDVIEVIFNENKDHVGSRTKNLTKQNSIVKITGSDDGEHEESDQQNSQNQQKQKSESESSIQESSKKLKQSNVTFHKYYQIFKIQKISGICLLNKQGQSVTDLQSTQLVIASNSLIYFIDQTQKQLIYLQQIDQKITHIHSFCNIYAVVTQLKYIIVLREGIVLQKAKCSQVGLSIGSVINGFKMTADNIIIAIDQFIQVYFKTGGNYLDREPKRIKLEHGIPIHIAMTSIPKVFLLITREKSILKLNSQSKQKNPILTAKQLNCDFLQTFYPQMSTIKAPILFCGTRNMFLIAQPNGNIHYYSSLNHMINKNSLHSTLNGHTSHISELTFTQKGFISSGIQDGQVIIWQNAQILIENEQQNQEEEEIITKSRLQKARSKRGDEHFLCNKNNEENNLKIQQSLYIEEVQCLGKFVCDRLLLKDSQVQVIVKDPQYYKDIGKNINNILVPKNTDLFEPLANKKKQIELQMMKKNSKKNFNLQINPSLSFKCVFIYGFNSEKARQTLFYVHQYPQTKIQQNIFDHNKKNSMKQGKKTLQFPKQLLLPLNQTHRTCRRSFFYFTGRIGVLWSPSLKAQSHYDFHINRITCAAVNPNKTFVCTSEASVRSPIIHIWSANSVTMVCSFVSNHQRFIDKIQFSRDGNFIVSLGGLPFQQSIQVHNVVREQSICFKYVENTCFYDIKFDPYNSNEIAACGVKSLWVMAISNRTLIKKQQAKLSSNQEVTCMVYTSSVYGNTIESDIITGNSYGDISLFICGKYILCKKSAHEKSINCIKLCELFKYWTVIITAGEDNMIKLWDTKFNEISKINIKQILSSSRGFSQGLKSSIAPQSIDVYHCFGNNDGKSSDLSQEKSKQDRQENNTETMLLVGTRNGSIFQIKISNQYQGIKMYMNSPRNAENLLNQTKVSQKIQINYVTHFNNLPSSFHKSVIFDIKGNLMVTLVKGNQCLVLWNIQKRQMLKVFKSNSYPCTIKFSKNGFICVGYTDGRIEFLQIGSSYNFIVREQKLFLSWDFQPMMIVCSQNDSRIAVVYVKQIHQKRTSNINRQQSSQNQGQQILVTYQKVFSSSNSHTFVSNDKNTFRIPAEKRKIPYIFWMQFNSSGNKLLICYTLNNHLFITNQNRRRVMSSYQGSSFQQLYDFVVFDLITKNQKKLDGQQFNSLNFAPALRAKYHYYRKCELLDELYNREEQRIQQNKNKVNDGNMPNTQITTNMGIQHNHMQQKGPSTVVPASSMINQQKEDFVPICQMAQYQSFTLMGTIYGELFAVKSSQFYSQSAEEQYEPERKSIKSKCFACLDSPITNMQVVNNTLYVSARDCSTVIEYQLMVEEGSGKNKIQDNAKGVEKQNKKQDIGKYYQSYTQEKIQGWLKYVFPKRKNFYEYNLNRQDKKNKENRLKNQKDELIIQPYHIIGRNALYKRNNILIDLKDNLITFSGCNLLIMSPKQSKNSYKQQFLKLDNSIFSVNPQISTITLSIDKRTLYAGTCQQNCQIIIWDISTRTELQHICFKDYVSVIMIKVSEEQRHAVVLVLSKQAKQIIFFISLTSFSILASFCVEEEAQIFDMEFLPENQFKFLACGANYLAEWALKGGLLTCEKYNMKNPKDFIDFNHQNHNKSFVIFYSIIFLKDVAVTGGSDGYLYMWSDRNLIKKQNANPKAAILTLFSSKNSKIFASGAVDGKAIVWQLGSSSIIQKVYEFNIYPGKQNIIPNKFQIQSVNIGQNQVFVGTRSGEIYKFQLSHTENTQNQQHYNPKQSQTLILSAFDNDHVNSCSFNISSQKLYILTQSGIFSVFNLNNNEKIKQEKIKVQNNQELVKMLACKLSSKIYVILKKCIDVYNYIEDGKHSNKFSKSKQCLKIPNSQIKAAILSLNQQYLALLMSPNHLQNAKIQIYDMKQQDGNNFYSQFKVLQNIPANIQIIDFSTDNGYLVYKSSDEDETIISLTTKQIININTIQCELQWNQQAKKTSKYIRGICSTYSDENKLKTILQIMNHSVLATDEMGSVRIFHYDQNLQESSVEYYKIYLEHLNDVYLCILSSDCSILVTVGSQDKSIIIWKVKNFEMLMKKTQKKTLFSKKIEYQDSKKM